MSRTTLPNRMTAAWLKRHGACADQVALFARTWPNGCALTVATARRAARLGLSVSWLSQFLSAPAWRAYEKAIATTAAWRAYEEAIATTTAWRVYEEATTTATAWRAYEEAKATAWRVYEEATVAALIRAARLEG